MSNSPWITTGRKLSPEGEALRETFLIAQPIGFHLLCASNALPGDGSPDVTACAAIIRDALHSPEKDRVKAVKTAQDTVLQRQANYVSRVISYQQHLEDWKAIRSTLVAQLEALLAPPTEPVLPGTHSYFDIDLIINCATVARLIDDTDIAVNEASKIRYGQPTEKHAQAGFQKVFDYMAAEVAEPNWLFNARFLTEAGSSTYIFNDIPVEKIASTEVPSEFEKCCALVAARSAFERIFDGQLTGRCRDFAQETRGSINDTQMSESLIAATPDLTAMMRIEEQREKKLLAYGCTWRWIRSSIENAKSLFINVVELLPEAIAEAAAIQDETMRRRAQNLCLFAARRLKENLKFIRDCNRYVAERDPLQHDITMAVNRSHQALVDRVRSKAMRRPTTACRPETYMG